MAKTREEVLKEKYGFNSGSYRYVPAGSEILKSIGQSVVWVRYKRNKQEDTKPGEEWKTEFSQVGLKSISDFDPLNSTYLCTIVKEDKSEYSFRMIPEGYSWVETETPDEIERILPVSMHNHLFEDEMFYARLSGLYDTRDTLPIDVLKTLSGSKDKIATLGYSRHLACLIRLGDGDTLYFRVLNLGLKHKAGTQYSLSVSDGENTYRVMVEPGQKSYPFESIGEFKLIDLMNESKDLISK